MLSISTSFWVFSSFYTHLAPGQAVQAAAGLFLAQKAGCIRISVRFPGLQFAQLWINNGSFRCKTQGEQTSPGAGAVSIPERCGAEISCAGGRSGMLNKLNLVRAPRAARLRPQPLPACFQGCPCWGWDWNLLVHVPRREISHLSMPSPVPGRSSVLGPWDCCPDGPWWPLCRWSGGCGGKGITSQTHAEDLPLHAQPCLVGSRVRLSMYAEKNAGRCSSSTELVAVKWN